MASQPYIRSPIQSGVPEVLPMLFVGKVALDDLPLLYERYREGVISAPRYVPSMFRDLNGLYVRFGFSSSMSLMNIARVQKHFSQLFESLPATTPLYAGSNNGKRDAELD